MIKIWCNRNWDNIQWAKSLDLVFRFAKKNNLNFVQVDLLVKIREICKPNVFTNMEFVILSCVPVVRFFEILCDLSFSKELCYLSRKVLFLIWIQFEFANWEMNFYFERNLKQGNEMRILENLSRMTDHPKPGESNQWMWWKLNFSRVFLLFKHIFGEENWRYW